MNEGQGDAEEVTDSDRKRSVGQVKARKHPADVENVAAKLSATTSSLTHYESFEENSESKTDVEDKKETDYCFRCITYWDAGKNFALKEKYDKSYYVLEDTSEKKGAEKASLRDGLGFYIIIFNTLQITAIVAGGVDEVEGWRSATVFLSIFTLGFDIFSLGEVAVNVLTLFAPVLLWMTYSFLQDRPDFSLHYLARKKLVVHFYCLYIFFTLLLTIIFFGIVLDLENQNNDEDLGGTTTSNVNNFHIISATIIGAINVWSASFLFVFIIGTAFLSKKWIVTLWENYLWFLELLIIGSTLPVGNLVAQILFIEGDFKVNGWFLGLGVAVMIVQLCLVTVIAATSNIKSAFDTCFWKWFIYSIFCRCGFFARTDFSSANKIKWPYKQDCWAFPVVILLESWILLFLVAYLDFSDDELEIFNNESSAESNEVLRNVIVRQGSFSILIILFTTICMLCYGKLCRKSYAKNTWITSPYKKNMHLWFAVVSRIGTMTLIILGMIYDIYEDSQLPLLLFMSLLSVAAVVLVGVVCGWYGLFSTPFSYQYKLKSYCLFEVTNDNSKDQAEVLIEEYRKEKIRFSLESWALLSPNQRLYALTQITDGTSTRSRPPNCFVDLCQCSSKCCWCAGTAYENVEYVNLTKQIYLVSKLLRSKGGKSLKDLVCLEINDANFKKYAWDEIKVHELLTKLKSLVVTHSKFEDDAFESFCKYLKGLKTSLEFLNLSNCNISANNTPSLVHTIKKMKCLKYFKMQNNIGNVDITLVIEAIKFIDKIIVDIQGTNFDQNELFKVLIDKIVDGKVRDIEILLCSELEDERISWDNFESIAMLLWIGVFRTFVFDLRSEKWLRRQKEKRSDTKKDQIVLNHIKGVAKILNRELSFNYNTVGELFDDAVNSNIERKKYLRERYLGRVSYIGCYIAGILMAYQKKDSINNEKKFSKIVVENYIISVKGIEVYWVSMHCNKIYENCEEFWRAACWVDFAKNNDYEFLKEKVRTCCEKDFPNLEKLIQ